MTVPGSIEVLLVEDDPGDVLMTQEAFAEHKLVNTLHVVTNGEDALAYLRKQGAWADARTPDLVLLDLNLPRVDGRQVLAEIKSDPALAHLPVVVLTTSDLEEDVVASYKLHANAYVQKPVDFSAFVDVVKAIEGFFISVVRLPGR